MKFLSEANQYDKIINSSERIEIMKKEDLLNMTRLLLSGCLKKCRILNIVHVDGQWLDKKNKIFLEIKFQDGGRISYYNIDPSLNINIIQKYIIGFIIDYFIKFFPKLYSSEIGKNLIALNGEKEIDYNRIFENNEG